MKRLAFADYSEVLPLLSPSACGAVYPRSVAEGIQGGDIYSDGNAALIWHDCGFAFLCGNISQDLLQTVYTGFLQKNAILQRRFLLFADTPEINAFFSQKQHLLIERRLFFIHTGTIPTGILSSDEQISEISSRLISRICGRITPSFSWNSDKSFLQNGKGYCVTVGGEPAAWSFSAAVSADEIDIGVETGEAFRKNGYAFAAAAEMVRYAYRQHKKPVWACHAENTASKRLAEKLGFLQTAECCTIRQP